MKEDPALIEVISFYASARKPDDLVYWIAAKGNARKSALSLAFVGNRPRHVLCVLNMINTWLEKGIKIDRDALKHSLSPRLEIENMLTDTFENLVRAFRDGKIQKDKTEGVSNIAGRLASKIRRNEAYFELIAGKYLSEFSLTITKEELEKLEKLAELNESPQQLNASESGSAQLQHSTILETSIYSDSHIKNLCGESHGYPLKTSASEESVYLSANEESIADVY
ncbi:hypothetical protein GRF29_112g1352225 [Pseudopithomyces chartarum]|uniref:Uncharacterized protein n=1 Tax=Pseudopithomyces chartarum TaxID=1892770 RepID=A0AAN6LS60_9PLEO|nr:hypothetical protein GRF29_112g1352225 [Pseudopithomyces chartarum]